MTKDLTIDTDISNKLGCLLVHAGQLYQRKANAALKPLGITELQCKMLYGVVILAQRQPKVSQNDLVKALQLNKAMASLVLKKLIGKGYLTRTEDDQDSRVKNLHITEAGIRLLNEAKPIFQALDQIIIDSESVDIEKMCTMLLAIIRASE